MHNACRLLSLFVLTAAFVWPQNDTLDPVERLLKELTEAHGPSGYEGPVRRIMRREFTPLADDIQTDGLGSLIARLDGSSGIRVMMAAHMDEVGMLVRRIRPDGYLTFQTVGGWLGQALINQRYIIMTRNGPVRGITGLKTPHVTPQSERPHLHDRDRIFIDVGARDQRDAEERLGIRPGDPIAPDSPFMKLNDPKLYAGKAWDDRIGLAVEIEVLKRLRRLPPPNTVFAVATVQEEVGLRGAQTSSNIVKPDIGISIEVGVAADYPFITQDQAQERLGGGPGIFLHDSSMIPNVKFRDFVADLADSEDIPLQFEVLSGYGEDGAMMQRAHGGAPSINITVPTRYLHNHNGVLHRDDFDRAVDLVEHIIRRLDPATVERLKRFD
ncbi:MAG: M42 family metallopeptidase [Bryobacterales bacterium]|nr:M42 family metallopeptidase [Bryobacterales bacterium]